VSFISVEFIILVIITLTIYYLPPFRKWQPIVLITAGLVFYGYGNHYRTLLLICSALINFSAAYVCLTTAERRLQVLSTTVGVILNLFLLGFFKYGKPLALTVSTYVAGTNELVSFVGNLAMPIGLSFFTFQGISLLVDALRNKINLQSHGENRTPFMKQGAATFLFIGFFPTLLSGPIMKAHQFLPQISVKRFNDIDWERCVKELILGYFLKMVIADNLKDQTFWLAYPLFMAYSPTTLLVFLLGYSIQIFADFAGYSLIAIGIARLAGYSLPDNFNFPYISRTFSEFWRRWHISLSTWLRDYLYIPLGGNRKDSVRTYINLFIVMFLGGLWHGSTWNYGLWGAYHGTLLMLERPFRDKLANLQHPVLNLAKGLVVFCLVTVGWLFFKLAAFHEVTSFVKALWATGGIYGTGPIRWIILYSIPIGLYHLLYLLKQRFGLFNVAMEDSLYAVMVFAIICCSGSPSTFIYFQF
jgi:alginate O-acetyltransferase complex protein AlgI